MILILCTIYGVKKKIYKYLKVSCSSLLPGTDQCLKQSAEAGHHNSRGQYVRLGRVLW